MAVGWFIAPYARRDVLGRPGRACVVLDAYAEIASDGGDLASTEVLGDRAVVKIRATESTLAAVAALDGVIRLPLTDLDASLAALPVDQRDALRDELLAMGYTEAQVASKIGADPTTWTLRDALRMACSRRLRPRYDEATDTIVCDGMVQPVALQPDELDAAVTN